MIPIYITDVTWFTAINSDVMSFKKFHESKLWPNPCNSHVMSHCLCLFHMWRSCVRVFGSKPCAALRVEVCRWRGAGSCRSEKVFGASNLAQFSAQGPATSDAATETAQNLATLTRAAKCWRAQDRNINYCWCNFCLVYLISRGILPLNGLVLVTVDHASSKLRHGSQRFLWCCYSSRGRKNFEVFVSVVFSCVCIYTLRCSGFRRFTRLFGSHHAIAKLDFLVQGLTGDCQRMASSWLQSTRQETQDRRDWRDWLILKFVKNMNHIRSQSETKYKKRYKLYKFA